MHLSLLAIDSDPYFTTALSTALTPEGYVITVATDGDSGIKQALNQSFDVILLSLFIPKKNGFEVLKAIRAHQHVPVLMLSTQAQEMDRLLSFNLGADDFIVKPCNPKELIAKLHAILRRTQKTIPMRETLQNNGITLDGASRRVIKEDQFIELTNTEFNILEMLMRSPGQAFSKEELTEYALGRKYSAYDRSIDVHVSHLRIKLGQNSSNEMIIKTIRGFGYAFTL